MIRPSIKSGHDYSRGHRQLSPGAGNANVRLTMTEQEVASDTFVPETHVNEGSTKVGLQPQISIGGFANNVCDVWADHYALVMPSRYEGNALAMIEAMLCGRVPIVTDVGRASGLIADNVCGFIAPAPTVSMLDEALERAWQSRHKWQSMGVLASERSV